MEFIDAIFDAAMAFLTIAVDLFNKVPFGDYINIILDKLM